MTTYRTLFVLMLAGSTDVSGVAPRRQRIYHMSLTFLLLRAVLCSSIFYLDRLDPGNERREEQARHPNLTDKRMAVRWYSRPLGSTCAWEREEEIGAQEGRAGKANADGIQLRDSNTRRDVNVCAMYSYKSQAQGQSTVRKRIFEVIVVIYTPKRLGARFAFGQLPTDGTGYRGARPR